MRLLSGDARAERLSKAAAKATAPPAHMLLLIGLCATLWLLSGLWRNSAAPQHPLPANSGCEAAAAVDDGTPTLPARSGFGGEAGALRPWVQQARDELAGLTEQVQQLQCVYVPVH